MRRGARCFFFFFYRVLAEGGGGRRKGERRGCAAFAVQVNGTITISKIDKFISHSVGERESMPGHVTKQRRTRMRGLVLGTERVGVCDGGGLWQWVRRGTDGSGQTHSDLEEGFFTFGLFRR